MTDLRDAIEKVALAIGHPHNTAARDDAKDALRALTPGTRFTSADEREMVVVPVDASEATISTMVQCGLSARLGEAYLWPDYMRDLYKIAITAAASEPDASQASERGE